MSTQRSSHSHRGWLGRQCKQATIEASRDYAGAWDWWTYVSPGECGAKNGSKMTFMVGAGMDEAVIFNNSRRASPQITFQALMDPNFSAGTRR